jgi:hypothetical protein
MSNELQFRNIFSTLRSYISLQTQIKFLIHQNSVAYQVNTRDFQTDDFSLVLFGNRLAAKSFVIS